MAKTARAQITAQDLQRVQQTYLDMTGKTASLVLDSQRNEEKRLAQSRHASTDRVREETTQKNEKEQLHRRQLKKQSQLAYAQDLRRRKIRVFRELLEDDEEVAAQQIPAAPITQNDQLIIIPPRNNVSSQNVPAVAFRLNDPAMLSEVLRLYMEIMGRMPQMLAISMEEMTTLLASPLTLFSVPGVTTPVLAPKNRSSSVDEEQVKNGISPKFTPSQRFEFTFDTVDQYQRFVQAISPFANFSRAPELTPGKPIKLHLDVEQETSMLSNKV